MSWKSALAACLGVPLTKPTYIDILSQSANSMASDFRHIPYPTSYPANIDWSVRPERATLFQDYIFIFWDQIQYDLFSPAISAASGKPSLYDQSPEKNLTVKQIVDYTSDLIQKITGERNTGDVIRSGKVISMMTLGNETADLVTKSWMRQVNRGMKVLGILMVPQSDIINAIKKVNTKTIKSVRPDGAFPELLYEGLSNSKSQSKYSHTDSLEDPMRPPNTGLMSSRINKISGLFESSTSTPSSSQASNSIAIPKTPVENRRKRRAGTSSQDILNFFSSTPSLPRTPSKPKPSVAEPIIIEESEGQIPESQEPTYASPPRFSAKHNREAVTNVDVLEEITQTANAFKRRKLKQAEESQKLQEASLENPSSKLVKESDDKQNDSFTNTDISALKSVGSELKSVNEQKKPKKQSYVPETENRIEEESVSELPHNSADSKITFTQAVNQIKQEQTKQYASLQDNFEDISDLKNLALVETSVPILMVHRPASHANEGKWAGRPNFKRFSRNAQGTLSTSQVNTHSVVTLVETNPRKFRVESNVEWLENEAPRKEQESSLFVGAGFSSDEEEEGYKMVFGKSSNKKATPAPVPASRPASVSRPTPRMATRPVTHMGSGVRTYVSRQVEEDSDDDEDESMKFRFT